MSFKREGLVLGFGRRVDLHGLGVGRWGVGEAGVSLDTIS